MKTLGVEPGIAFDPENVGRVDGAQLADVARRVQQEATTTWNRPDGNPFLEQVVLPKGQMTLDAMVIQSAFGPIGLPAHQAVYRGISTADGQPMNAMYDYVLRMAAEELPPARAFWSATLYDLENGFFIPNERKKYSVGENAGFKLDADGGIKIHIAAEQPEGVPIENWLPINRQDQGLDMVMLIYDPELDRLKSWQVPAVEKING
jgi:hypothetical protein